MKKGLMEFIICPNCKEEFSLDIYKENNNEIEEGLLFCKSCNATFPVIGGIPRILDRTLLPELVTGYDDFLKEHGGKVSPESPYLVAHDTDKRIAQGFEFEWQKHSKILPEHEKEYLHVFGDVLPASEIKDKIVLDAGCGQGRFSYFTLKHGAKAVISFDLGEQTLIAYKNLSGQENSHVVQASIYSPPFKPVFDLIFSIGVIHHLPNPEKGFHTLYGLLKYRGKIFIWVYGYSSIIPIIVFLRKFTLGNSVKTNRLLGFFLAIPLYLINLFYNILIRIPVLKYFAPFIPFHMYHDRGFSNIWTICFDKINSGIAVYYRREDLQGWLDRLSDKSSGILDERYPGKSGSSWRLMAQNDSFGSIVKDF